MKIILSVLFLLVLSVAHSQLLEFHKIPKTTVELRHYDIAYKGKTKKVAPFNISNQVTVDQYKLYLKSVLIDSGYTYFLSQCPSEKALKNITVEEYLTNPKFGDFPIAGVSWINTINYCKWLNYNESYGDPTLVYRLPYLSEWYAAKNKADKIKDLVFNTNYADWTLNNYSESSFMLDPANLDHFFLTKPDDPQVLKRFIVLGNSFHGNGGPSGYLKNLYNYADSAQAFVSFRVVKAALDKPLWQEKYRNFLMPKKVDSEIDFQSYNDQVVAFNTEDSYLHGKYISFYEHSKQKKFEGMFEMNQRKGLWNYYDKKGKLLVSRFYFNNQHYYDIIRKRNLDAFQKLETKIKLETIYRDSNNLCTYPFVREADVHSSKRIWRSLYFEQNLHISKYFELVKNQLIQAVANDELTVYDASNDLFKTPLESDEGLKMIQTDLEIIGFGIKEDHFMDFSRGLTDVRIIGISFLIQNENGKLENICWFYYPQLRRQLAQIQVDYHAFPNVNHLEDIFHFRQFVSSITKESNLYDSNLEGSEPYKNIHLIEYQNGLLEVFQR